MAFKRSSVRSRPAPPFNSSGFNEIEAVDRAGSTGSSYPCAPTAHQHRCPCAHRTRLAGAGAADHTAGSAILGAVSSDFHSTKSATAAYRTSVAKCPLFPKVSLYESLEQMAQDVNDGARAFEPILRTKLHRPQLDADLLNRGRLLEVMDRAD